MSRAGILDVLSKLEEHYTGYELTKTVAEDFVALFADVDDSLLEEARRVHLSRSGFFPKCAELSEIVRSLEAGRTAQQQQKAVADFWTNERRELWAAMVAHGRGCSEIIDEALDCLNAESALAVAARHLKTCEVISE